MAFASQLNRCQKSSLLHIKQQQHEAEGAGVCQSLDMPKLLILVKFDSNPKLSSAFSAPAVVTRQVPGIGSPGWFNALEEDRRVVQAGVQSAVRFVPLRPWPVQPLVHGSQALGASASMPTSLPSRLSACTG